MEERRQDEMQLPGDNTRRPKIPPIMFLMLVLCLSAFLFSDSFQLFRAPMVVFTSSITTKEAKTTVDIEATTQEESRDNLAVDPNQVAEIQRLQNELEAKSLKIRSLENALEEARLPSENSNKGIPSHVVPTTSSIDRSWCPTAECHSSPLCRPCQRRFLIIITTGRSASTTLTSMMDLLPGVRMSGECNNAIQHIRTMIESITGGPFLKNAQQTTGPWARNPIPAGSLACVSQKMIESITPPMIVNKTGSLSLLKKEEEEANEIVGFKTIRLLQKQTVSDLPKITKFLHDHFPCARYLINYRSDIQKMAESYHAAWVGNRTLEWFVTDLSKTVDFTMELAKHLGKNENSTLVLDSTKWTSDIAHLNQAVAWLGFDPTLCAFPRLLEMNTGRTMGGGGAYRGGAYQNTFTKLSLDPRCRYIGN